MNTVSLKASRAAEDSPTRVSLGSVALLNAVLKRHAWMLQYLQKQLSSPRWDFGQVHFLLGRT